MECLAATPVSAAFGTGAADQRTLGPDVLLALAAPWLVAREDELLVAGGLDRHGRLRCWQMFGSGDRWVRARPCGIARTLAHSGTCFAFLAHNHPSGNPMPSDADRAFTAQFARTAAYWRIRLIDHLIIGHAGNWRSMRRLGWL